MPWSRKTQISLIDTPYTIVFLAMLAVRFCAVWISIRGTVTSIAVVGWKSVCCFYRQCFQLAFVHMQ
jgi:heme/copper-type cytochrome/quinol oxidase subunit 4